VATTRNKKAWLDVSVAQGEDAGKLNYNELQEQANTERGGQTIVKAQKKVRGKAEKIGLAGKARG